MKATEEKAIHAKHERDDREAAREAMEREKNRPLEPDPRYARQVCCGRPNAMCIEQNSIGECVQWIEECCQNYEIELIEP